MPFFFQIPNGQVRAAGQFGTDQAGAVVAAWWCHRCSSCAGPGTVRLVSGGVPYAQAFCGSLVRLRIGMSGGGWRSSP